MKSCNIPNGLASIIIPCLQELEFTRHCIAALTHHIRAPWELIVVNNGSTDATADYLGGVQDAASVPVTVIANASNRGFLAAINQGLQAASGEYLVLLNNDVVVTDSWLDQLIALANVRTDVAEACASPPLTPKGPPLPSSPPIGEESSQVGEKICSPTVGVPNRLASTIGLVGPMSNYAAPPRLVAEVDYRDLDQMHAFARRWRDEHRGQWFTVPKLSGFCLLIKRAVYDAIGGLDERFGLGFVDDDDLAERARRAGFACAVAHDLLVHHFGSRTFVRSGIETRKLLDENAQRFAAKWGLPRAPGKAVALSPFVDQPRNTSDDEQLRERTSLPRIVADERGSDVGEDQELIGIPAVHNRVVRGCSPTIDEPLTESAAFARPADPRSCALIRGEKRCSLRSAGASAVKVSLTMIVRDEENNLPHALGSVQTLFDEIVVVDTGSTDRTKEIALEFGARVFDFVWIDDFSAARNAALEHATSDYAFWLDADDVVDSAEWEKLNVLLDGLGRAGLAFWRAQTRPV